MSNSKISRMDIELENVEFVSHVETVPVFKLTEEVANNLEKYLVFEEWTQRDSDLVDEFGQNMPLMAKDCPLRGLIYDHGEGEKVERFSTKNNTFTCKYSPDEQTIHLVKETSRKPFPSQATKIWLTGKLERVDVNDSFLVIQSLSGSREKLLITFVSLETFEKVSEISLEASLNDFESLAVTNDTMIYAHKLMLEAKETHVLGFVRLADPSSHARLAWPSEPVLEYARHHQVFFSIWVCTGNWETWSKLVRIDLDKIEYRDGIQDVMPNHGLVDVEVPYHQFSSGLNFIDGHAFFYAMYEDQADCQLIDLESMATVDKFIKPLESDIEKITYDCGLTSDFEIKVAKNKTIKIVYTGHTANLYLAVCVVKGKAVVREGEAPKNLGKYYNINDLETKFKAKVVSSKEIRIMPITKH